MTELKHNPFAGLNVKDGKVTEDEQLKLDFHKPKPRRKKKKPSFAFVLQAFNGKKWKLIRKDGHLIASKQCKQARTTDLVKCLRDGKFVSQMKVQVYGRNYVSDKKFFATPVRWRRITDVSHV